MPSQSHVSNCNETHWGSRRKGKGTKLYEGDSQEDKLFCHGKVAREGHRGCGITKYTINVYKKH